MYFGPGNPAGAGRPDLSTAIFEKLEITTLKVVGMRIYYVSTHLIISKNLSNNLGLPL